MGDQQPMADMHGAPRRVAGARWFVLLAALFAFSWQNVVAATHHHSRTETVSRVDSGKPGSAAQPATQGDPQDSPANCPICRELAHTAYYLPPAPVALTAPLSTVAPRAVVAALALAPGQRWHGWRSRAPPTSPEPD